MNTINVFPIKIYKTIYNNFDVIKEKVFSKLTDLFEETKNNNVDSMQAGTLCTYFTNSKLQQNLECKEFVDFAEYHARIYWKELKYSPLLQPKVIQIWANETPHSGWIRSHLHGSMPMTGVLYVNASKEMGNLVIENPLDAVLSSQPMDYAAQEHLNYEIEVNSGDFVIFPGWIRHHVKPNTTNEKRLILGINFGSKGEYLTGQWVSACNQA
jgi:uncharacterized protein (TIGR02466 family)